VIATLLLLTCLTRAAAIEQGDAAQAVRAALDARDFARAEALMDEVDGGARPLLDARMRFEVGDFVECTRIAAAALATAPDSQHRELAWWGSKAALWLQDARGAEIWTARLTDLCVGDPAWESVAREYSALADGLARGADDERRALDASRWTVAAFVLLSGAGALLIAWRGARR